MITASCHLACRQKPTADAAHEDIAVDCGALLKVAGEVYGRGPLVTAIPDIKTLNKTLGCSEERQPVDAGVWRQMAY